MDSRIIKYFLGELSEKERIELLSDINIDQELKSDFLMYKNTSVLTTMFEQETDIAAGEQSFRNFVTQKKKKGFRKKALSFVRNTAAIAILVISTYYITTLLNKQPQLQIVSNKLTVPAGQRANLVLGDGTEVWLNANSTLIYPSAFDNTKRNVRLSGEAYFKVAKNEKAPFIVETADLKLQVLGTEFNINNYPNSEEASVNLIEGSVKIECTEGSVTLTPNDKLNYKKGGSMTVSKYYNEDYFLWTEGIYTFEKILFSDLVKKLELYYDVKIIIKKESLYKNSYSGKFRQRDGVIEILRILQKIQPFTIVKDDENNTITIE